VNATLVLRYVAAGILKVAVHFARCGLDIAREKILALCVVDDAY
jgi:hypothetical protein